VRSDQFGQGAKAAKDIHAGARGARRAGNAWFTLWANWSLRAGWANDAEAGFAGRALRASRAWVTLRAGRACGTGCNI